MMTAEEKYLFDLHGFIVLRDVLSPEDLRRAVELTDRWHALPDEELPEPLYTYRDPTTKPTTPRSIVNAEYADPVFERMCLNKAILRPVLALTAHATQLMITGLTRNTRESDEIPFHGGVAGGFHHPANDYQATGDRCFATFLNAAVSLVDVPEGAGFVCVPGSHKAHFQRPDGVDIHAGPPTVANVCPWAGDCVLFTETLCHGARRWTADEPRRTIFIRYCTSYASWSPGYGPDERFRGKVSDELLELKRMAGHQERKKVVARLLGELGEA